MWQDTFDGATGEVAGPHPLEEVKRRVADGSCSALSLDVFDTVLWRRVPRPADLFSILGARLRDRGGCPGWLSDASFRRMRVTAERDARSACASLGSEVSLFEIWEQMPLTLFKTGQLETLVEAELELEREFAVVDLEIAEVIRFAAKQALPIVLVSDTYFTEEQLNRLLDRPELESLAGAHVFRSSQHGAGKASGLWKVVLNEMNLRPSQVIHIGDNKIADFTKPSSLGIRTVRYARMHRGLARLLAREGPAEEPCGPLPAHGDSQYGDYGLTSLRSKALHRVPFGPTTGVETALQFGATVLGPVLTGFAEWVASTAHQSGESVVWCPMREGALLSTLVNNAAETRGWPVRAKRLWLSRHVTAVAGLASADYGSVRAFIRRGHRLSVRQLLANMHLRPGDVPALAANLDAIVDDGTFANRIATALTETAYVRNRIKVAATGARERLLTALERAGALHDPSIMLVDLGWGATTQYQLDRVFRLAQIDVDVSGLYLATDHRSTRLHRAGLRAEGYLGQAGHPHSVAGTISRSPEVIEHCVNAPCGSLIDFSDDGEPVLGPYRASRSQDAERQAVEAGVLAFQAQWNRYAERGNGAWPELTGSARHLLANILTSALRAPTPDEASLFGNWCHEENLGSTAVTHVLPDDLASALPYLSPGNLDDLRMRDAFWPRLLASYEPYLAATTRALDAGLAGPDAFDPAGTPFSTRVRWRGVSGRWHQGPAQRIRINHNGLSFVRLHIEERGIREVTVALPGRPAIVRIDWIEAVVQVPGDSATKTMRWETPDEISGIVSNGCQWLGANIVEFRRPDGILRLPLTPGGSAPVGSVRLSMAFAMLPRSRSGLEPQPSAPPEPQVAEPPHGLKEIHRLSTRAVTEYRARGVGGVIAGAKRMTSRQRGRR